MFRTEGMSQEDKVFEDKRDDIIESFNRGYISETAAFERLKGLGLSDEVAFEDLNL